MGAEGFISVPIARGNFATIRAIGAYAERTHLYIYFEGLRVQVLSCDTVSPGRQTPLRDQAGNDFTLVGPFPEDGRLMFRATTSDRYGQSSVEVNLGDVEFRPDAMVIPLYDWRGKTDLVRVTF